MLPPEEGRPDGRAVADGEWGRERIEYDPTRVIIKLRRPEDAESAAQLPERSAELIQSVEGASVLRRPSSTGRVVLRVGADTDVLALAQELSHRDDIEYAEPDLIDHAAITPNDLRYVEQWALPRVDAPGAWDRETGATTVVIGVIDSGISMSAVGLDHPDLSDAARITLGTDFVDGGDPRDLNGHGTHVAGIAAAAGNNTVGVAGMNWGSRLYICRTLDNAGNGSSADFADAVEEITDFAVAAGAKAVINYSGGGGANQTKLDACNYASSRGMLLCAAAGNDFAGPVIWPAAYSTTVAGVIAVGSTTDTDAVSDFSNVGPEVTVVAPGSGILSTMPTYQVTLNVGLNYGVLDGTSMATPLVSGLAALMWSRNSAKTNASIRQCLIDTAVKLGPGSFDNAWGFGRVDASAAVRCVEPLPTITHLSPLCTHVSRVITCTPVSRLTDLCAVTHLTTQCPIDLTTRIPVRCFTHTRLMPQCAHVTWICPSAIDACPSSLRCFDPQLPVGGQQVTDPSGQPLPQPPTPVFIFVDELGRYHTWQPQRQDAGETWSAAPNST